MKAWIPRYRLMRILLVILCILPMVTCSDEIGGLLGGSDLSVGDLGPAGGYVFYDKGYFSDGWRYLEAAPAGWDGGPLDPCYIFGEYGSVFTPAQTETGIGTGEENTAKLVEAMGDDAHSQGYSTKYYAAKMCADYEITVRGIKYDDWFLPSLDELHQMYRNLKENNLGMLWNTKYWSSSEDSVPFNVTMAWTQLFLYDLKDVEYRRNDCRVRPVRAF